MSSGAKRILFVDDDEPVLRGLERMLFEQAEEWEMVFVDAPEKALDALNEARFDVIVSDARMAGMDGASLLWRIRAEHPDVIRIILTGHSELEATLRAMPVAHRFLTKPCQPALLVDVLRRSCSLQRLLEPEELRILVGGVAGLPVKPEVYARLTEATADPRVETSQIASIVSRDVALTSKVLHLTNSAFFGTGRNFSSVEQAVAFIGVRMLRQVCLSAEIFTVLGPEEASLGQMLDVDQRHALACAGIARGIATDREQGDHAFLAGMLHDIGKLIWRARARGSSRDRGESSPAGRDLSPLVEPIDAEAVHDRVGAYLLGLWGLEHPLVEAVAYHHDPACAGASHLDLPTIVHVADALAHEMENEHTSVESDSMLDRAHLGRIGVLGKLDEWRALGKTLWDRETR